jgi:hypothetical protein
MTPSGYPRIVKQWSRGTPMTAATKVYEGQPEDMYIAGYRDHTPGFERDFVSRTHRVLQRRAVPARQGREAGKVDAPNSANKSVHASGCCSSCAIRYKSERRQDVSGRRADRDPVRRLHGGQARLHQCCSRRRAHLARRLRVDAHHLVFNVMRGREEPLEVLRFSPGAGDVGRFISSRSPARRPRHRQRRRGRRRHERRRVGHLHRLPHADEPDARRRRDRHAAGSPQVQPAILRRQTPTSSNSTSPPAKDGTKMPYFLVRPKAMRSSTAARRRCSTATAASRSR